MRQFEATGAAGYNRRKKTISCA